MRVRITFQKTGSLRYSSILDLQKIWERALRRAKLPVEMSQGFNPHAKIQIAHPLPVGFSGKNEVVDIFLEKDISVETLEVQLKKALPEGLKINSIVNAPEKPRSLTGLFTRAEYLVTLRNTKRETVEDKITEIINSRNLIRERNKKEYDLRPLIHQMEIAQVSGTDVTLSMVLSTEPGKTGRPDEVVFQFGFTLSDCTIERTRLF
jgi:radical SAM-linked protein